MDTKTGKIYTDEEVNKITYDEKNLVRVVINPTNKQMSRKPPSVGRNERCLCGSGKKFKKCCLNK